MPSASAIRVNLCWIGGIRRYEVTQVAVSGAGNGSVYLLFDKNNLSGRLQEQPASPAVSKLRHDGLWSRAGMRRNLSSGRCRAS